MAGGANILSVRTRALPFAEFTPSTFGEVVTTSMASMARQLPNTFINIGEEHDAETARRDVLAERFGQDYIKGIESEIPMEQPSLIPFFDSPKDMANKRRGAINARIDADIEAGRAASPDAWQGIQTTEELRQQRRERAISSREIAEDFARRAPGPISAFAGQSIGSIGGAFTDPFNIATLPLGAVSGMRALTAIGTEAVTNAAIEALQTPEYVAWQKELSVDLTAGDIALNILTAGAGGAIFAGLTRGIGEGIRFAGSKSMPILERMARDKKLPAEVREGAMNLSRAKHVDESAFPTLRADESRVAVEQTVQAFEQYEQPTYTDIPFDMGEGAVYRQAPPSTFELGQLTGSRYVDYTKPSHQDIIYLDGINRQIQEFQTGGRVFIERDQQGGTPDIIGIKTESPKWFQDIKATREEVDRVTQKLKEGAPLGKREAVVADAMMGEVKASREENIRQWQQMREGRMAEREAEIDAIAAREAEAPPTYTRPNNALQSLHMETEAMDYQSVQPAFDADFERLVRDVPDMEIVNADGTVTSVREIKAEIAESKAELAALRICGIGGKS